MGAGGGAGAFARIALPLWTYHNNRSWPELVRFYVAVVTRRDRGRMSGVFQKGATNLEVKLDLLIQSAG